MKIVLASSAGGHLTELFELLPQDLNKDKFVIFTEKNDRTSKLKNKTYFFKPLLYNPFPYFPALLRCIKILRKENVNVLVTNGAEIGLPAIIAAKFLGIKTIYIDISAAATIRTLAGKFSYPFSDIFLVQYPEMARHYGKRAKYVGGIV